MTITDDQRRQRLVRRHHLARTAPDPTEAVRGVAAFHSTDPVTPYLGMWARVEGFDVADLDSLLLERRELWRLHAMRRTLFVVPTDEAGIFLHGTSADIARKERKRLRGWLASVMPEREVDDWLTRTGDEVVAFLHDDGGEWRTQDLGSELPAIDMKIEVGSGKWVATTPVSSRLLFLLAMEGRIVRTRPAGSWRSSQYRWSAATTWFDREPVVFDEAEARARLASRYLETHGPATLADVRWWTGWTLTQARTALAEVEAKSVSLERGQEGFVSAGDADTEEGTEEPVVTFLPGLDPTPMGWKERDWYLGPHGHEVFDRNGNVGPTVWVDGRIVGGWAQRSDGSVVYEILEGTDAVDVSRLDEEAKHLTEWLDGEVVSIRFRSPLERRLSGR